MVDQKRMEVLDILKEAPRIFFRNFNFVIVILLISVPVFLLMVYYEASLQRTLVEFADILEQPPGYYRYRLSILEAKTQFVAKDFYHALVQLSCLYLVPLHLLELSTVIVTIDLASKIYTEERTRTLKEMVQRPIYGARVKGTFITSFHVLFLSTSTLLGLLWLATSYFAVWRNSMFHGFFVVLYGPIFGALLIKYWEWSAVWNMGIVISVLEGTYGFQALALSTRFSKGSERRGLLLMLVFFVWGLGLRLPCLYFGCYGWIGIVAHVSLLCLANVLKCLVCVVYFHDCKNRTLEKKVDVEIGREIKAVEK